MKRQPSITLRLTLLFAFASATIFIGVGSFVAWEMNNHFKEMDVDELGGKLELIAHAVGETRNAAARDTLPNRLTDALVGHHALSANVSTQGKPVFATGSARFPDAMLASAMNAAKITRASLRTWSDRGDDYRGVAVRLPSAIPGAPPYTVALAINIAVHQRFAHSIRWTIWTPTYAPSSITMRRIFSQPSSDRKSVV